MLHRVIRMVPVCLAAAMVLAGSYLSAQGLAPDPNGSGQFPGGTWANFESPQCKPLAIARLGNVEDPSCYLLVCNTADNTLEIFDINGPGLPTAVDRVRVGLDPVSVIWREEISDDGTISGTIYTANMLGDSVSMIDFNGPSPTASLRATENVGDEPMHLALDGDGSNPVLYVTLLSRHAATVLDANTLAQLTPDPHIGIPGTVQFRRTSGAPLTAATAVIDSPRTILVGDTASPFGGTARVGFILGGVGTHHDFPGDPANANAYFETEIGFDLYWLKLSGPGPAFTGVHQKLGTRNFNMTFDNAGAIWVVSGDAANRKQKTKPAVNSEPTGFVRTLLHLIPSPAIPASAVISRDLNRQTTGGGIGSPVAPSISLSHCTDVAPYQRDDVYKVYVTALNNNGLGVIDNVFTGTGYNTNGNTWTRTFVNLDKGPGTFAGPSSLVIKYGADKSEDRIYVLNRFHASVDIVDPTSDTIIANFALQNDPEPEYIRNGREFLYGVAHGNGFNACESCHTSGRLDKLRWDLSDSSSTAPFSLQLISALEIPLWNDPMWNNSFNFTAPKGEFITQSLQGLVNFEVKQDFAQDTWFSNKPYHWDMDQAHFSDFNGGGFQSLLGGSGLTVGEMQTMIRFINSIHYPPNEEQSIDRQYRGDVGDPNTLFNLDGSPNGTFAQFGLKLFHQFSVVNGRACVQCHALPEGSNNLGTDPFFGRTILQAGEPPINLNTLPLVTPITLNLPMETAAMRGLAQKEGIYMGYAFGDPNRYKSTDMLINNYAIGPLFDPLYLPTSLHLDFPLDPVSSDFTSSNTLLHNGFNESINDFITIFFSVQFGGLQDRLDSATQFSREFDTGMAPAVGQVHTITSSGGNTAAVISLLEQVRVVNIGVAAYGQLGSTKVGFYYVPSTTAGVLGNFINVVSGATVPVATLLAAPTGRDVLVFEATPLGMERRKANPGITPTMTTGPAPANITLESMVPNRAYERVPEMTNNWDPFAASQPFAWDGMGATEPWDLKSLRLLQADYLPPGAPKNHEPARRFRVSGANIRPGAILRLWVPMSLPDPEFGDWYLMELPIFPSDKTDSDGDRIWETAVEADGQMAGTFAVGGYWSQGVHPGKINSVLIRTAVDNINESGFNPGAHFNSAGWNAYMAEVVNEDGTSGASAGQVISIEPPGFIR